MNIFHDGAIGPPVWIVPINFAFEQALNNTGSVADHLCLSNRLIHFLIADRLFGIEIALHIRKTQDEQSALLHLKGNHMNPKSVDRSKPENSNTSENDSQNETGGETYGNKPPIKDPKKNPRDPSEYEMK